MRSRPSESNQSPPLPSEQWGKRKRPERAAAVSRFALPDIKGGGKGVLEFGRTSKNFLKGSKKRVPEEKIQLRKKKSPRPRRGREK